MQDQFGLAFFLLVVNIVNYRLKIPLGMKNIVATDFNPLNENNFIQELRRNGI